jgi:hypothetical protein
MSTSVARRFGRIVIGLAFTWLVSGAGHLLAIPVDPAWHGSAATAAVWALIEGELTARGLPAGFQQELGYMPGTTAEGALVRPDGQCSTPIELGPDDFDDACRRHDLGYDLLRYAELTGRPLGPWARLQIDRRLAADLIASCRSPACRLAANVYSVAVTLNSIRQGFGAPMPEPVMPWLALVGGVVVCAGFHDSAARVMARAHRSVPRRRASQRAHRSMTPSRRVPAAAQGSSDSRFTTSP